MENHQDEKQKDLKRFAIAGGTQETVTRHGRASAEYIKAYRGVDNETGVVFTKSLRKIEEGKLTDYENNLSQQAGYAAEVSSTAKKNAEAIINKSGSKYVRSDDHELYGTNHNVVDIVEITPDGQHITSQMKFSKNPDGVLKNIACGEGGGKNDWSRYLDVDRLEVPSDQVEQYKNLCKLKSTELRKQADVLRENGNTELANKKIAQAENYEKIEQKITDSGITHEEAINARLHPVRETVKNIAKTSHRAGVQGAKYGAAIGGAISTIINIIEVRSGNKEFSEAVQDVAIDTLKSGGLGYATGFAGSALDSVVRQSSSQLMRNLSKAGLPAMIVSACVSAATPIRKFVRGEIDAGKLSQEIGLSVSGTLSAAAFSTLGQIAIPIPVIGGMIGGMIGYTITNTFYQSFFEVLKEPSLSAQRRREIEMQCEASIAIAREYRSKLEKIFEDKLLQLDEESSRMFAALSNPEISADEFCETMNQFGRLLGKKLAINSMAELDEAMLSDKPLTI